MKRKKIIFVCTGNTCRSPMAEAVLKDELKKRKIRWYSVSSAGLRAEVGSGLNPKSAAVLSAADIPVPAFESRQLTEKMIEEASAVVCMTEAQRRELSRFPNVTSMYALAGRDIPDPYGQDVLVYQETLRAICAAMPDIIERLEIRSEEETEQKPQKTPASKHAKSAAPSKTAKKVSASKSGSKSGSKSAKSTKTAKTSGSAKSVKTSRTQKSGKSVSAAKTAKQSAVRTAKSSDSLRKEKGAKTVKSAKRSSETERVKKNLSGKKPTQS